MVQLVFLGIQALSLCAFRSDGSIWAIPEPHLTIRRQLFWELASYDRFQGLILGESRQCVLLGDCRRTSA